MAWDDYTDGNFAANKSVPVGAGTWLLECDDELHKVAFAIEYASVNHNTSTWTSKFTFYLWIPDFADNHYLYMIPEAYKSVGGDVAQWRLRNSTDSNEGTTAVITSTSYDDAPESKVQVESSDQIVTFTVQLRRESGSGIVYVRNEDRPTVWFGRT